MGSWRPKWKSFGWHTLSVDGHDVAAISDAVDQGRAETAKPTMIICETVKGKGCSFAEGDLSNHNMVFSYEKAEEALAALESN